MKMTGAKSWFNGVGAAVGSALFHSILMHGTALAAPPEVGAPAVVSDGAAASVAQPAAPTAAPTATPTNESTIAPAMVTTEPAMSGLAVALAARLANGDAATAGAIINIDAARHFYSARGFKPLWLVDEAGKPRVTDAAGAVLAALSDADGHGLSARSYHVERISALSVGEGGEMSLDDRMLSVELLLTDGLRRFVDDLGNGRLTPRRVSHDLDIEPPKVDVDAVVSRVAASADVSAAIAAVGPQSPLYGDLRRLLSDLRRIERDGGWPVVGDFKSGRRKLEKGQSDPIVPMVRARLAATGEYTPPAPAKAPVKADSKGAAAVAKPNLVYDEATKAAVVKFQEHLGLEPDGVLGVGTLEAMNTSVSTRIKQVMANLERLRWRPGPYAARRVEVNLPDFHLTVFDQGAQVRDMRVIVGTQERRTPLFSSDITSVILNPTWTMPVKLAREDYLPKLLKNPNYLAEHGFTVYTSWGSDGKVVDSTTVDWQALGRRIGGMKLRQDPGPMNPLGQIKFNIRNDFDVYLHDTNQREKFSRAVRALSSGCVRLGDPMWLADFVFSDMPQWDAAGRKPVLDSLKTKHIALSTPVHVDLVYRTAWIDASGRSRFRADIHERDAEISAALERSFEKTQVAAR